MSNIFRKQGVNTGGSGGGSIDTSTLANKTDLTAIILTGTTNTSGGVISAGTWFYLNGKPCIAKVDIASGATFTEGTNYEEKTVGSALTELNSNIIAQLGTIYNASSTVSFEDACIKIGTAYGTFGRLLDSKVTTSSGTYTWNRDDGGNVTAIHSYAGHSNWIGGMMIDYGALICRYLGYTGVGYRVQFIAFPQV